MKDKGAAEAISTNLFLPLRLYVVFTGWLFVFLASIIEKSPTSFQESPTQTTTLKQGYDHEANYCRIQYDPCCRI